MSIFFYLIVFSYITFSSYAQVNECYSCASTILQYQWQATSFPFMPTSNLMMFDDNCGNDSQILSKFAKPCIGGVCVEELVVVGEQYAMVRGCHNILMGFNNYTTTLNMTKSSVCYYGETSGSVIYQNTPYFEPKIGVHFCNDTDLCNNKLSTNYSMFYESGWNGCETLPVTTCVSCEDYNGIGDCNNETQNCTGSWCTSIIGKIDDLPFITKGCVPYNTLSLSKASCVNISTSLIIGEMGDRITQNYTATHCLCNTGMCNEDINPLEFTTSTTTTTPITSTTNATSQQNEQSPTPKPATKSAGHFYLSSALIFILPYILFY